MPESAAIICTRNRPDALRNTLRSIAQQNVADLPTVFVIDSSDDNALSKNRKTASQFSSLSVVYHRYEGPPSAARQRNVGLRLLPKDTERVFFFDDDITLDEDCVAYLRSALTAKPSLAGVGGAEMSPPTVRNEDSFSRWGSALFKYLFLIDHPQPGRVLRSGHVSPYYSVESDEKVVSTEWLSTCCCLYDSDVFKRVRFEGTIQGALFEDRDLSYRITQFADLALTPKAQFVHHRSPLNRRSVREYNRDRMIQRYWFVTKSMNEPLGALAYWWATLGHILALLCSKKTEKWDALYGLQEGLGKIMTRSHPLLNAD